MSDALREPSARRDFSSLGLGSVVNGLAAFGIATTATHTYGSAGASPFVALWTIWLGATAVLTFPVQHWIILRARRAIPRAFLVTLAAGAGLLAGVACALSRHTIFGSSSWVNPLLAAAVVAGAVPIGVCRGALVSAGRARRTAILLGGENVLRFAAASTVAACGGGVTAFSATILVGYVVIASYPRVWRHDPEAAGSGKVSFAEIFRSVGLVGSSTLVAQVVLSAGPLIVAASGASARVVTATFATLEICEAPYLLALGTSLRFTALLAERRDSLPLRRVGLGVAAAGTIVTPIVAGIAALVGPLVIGLLFGSEAKLSATATAFIAAGSVLAVVALLLLLVAVAAERSPHVFALWCVALAIGIAVYAALPFAVDVRFAVAFTVVECAAVAGLTVVVVRSVARAPGGPHAAREP